MKRTLLIGALAVLWGLTSSQHDGHDNGNEQDPFSTVVHLLGGGENQNLTYNMTSSLVKTMLDRVQCTRLEVDDGRNFTCDECLTADGLIELSLGGPTHNVDEEGFHKMAVVLTVYLTDMSAYDVCTEDPGGKGYQAIEDRLMRYTHREFTLKSYERVLKDINANYRVENPGKCFTAESVFDELHINTSEASGGASYQELREIAAVTVANVLEGLCISEPVTVEDTSTVVDVACTSHNLEASFPRPRDNAVQVDGVQLAAPPCKAEENSTHIYIRAPLGECGTSREITPTEIIYRNLLTIGADPSNSEIIWQQVTKVPLECRLPRNKTVSLDFRPHFMSAFRTGVQGRGNFRISIDLFRTDGFLQPVTEYPFFVNHHEMLHVQIQVDSSDTSLQVFPLTCVATPSDKPDDKIQNDVIVDGCATLPTLQFYPSPNPDRWRFGFQAFAFANGVGMVYLHCDVLLCNATDPNSRCAQGCLTSGGRARREAGSEPDIYRLIQGPIVFSDDQTELQNVGGTTTDHQYVVTASAILGSCGVLTGAMFVAGIVYKARQEGRKAGC